MPKPPTKPLIGPSTQNNSSPAWTHRLERSLAATASRISRLLISRSLRHGSAASATGCSAAQRLSFPAMPFFWSEHSSCTFSTEKCR